MHIAQANHVIATQLGEVAHRPDKLAKPIAPMTALVANRLAIASGVISEASDIFILTRQFSLSNTDLLPEPGSAGNVQTSIGTTEHTYQTVRSRNLWCMVLGIPRSTSPAADRVSLY